LLHHLPPLIYISVSKLNYFPGKNELPFLKASPDQLKFIPAAPAAFRISIGSIRVRRMNRI